MVSNRLARFLLLRIEIFEIEPMYVPKQVSSQIKTVLWGGLLCWTAFAVAVEPSLMTPAQKLETGVVSWVSQQQGLKSSEVVMLPLDHRLRVQVCSSELKFDFPFSSAETVRVRCSQPVWQLFVRVSTGGAGAVGTGAGGGALALPGPATSRQVWVVEQHVSAGSPVSKRQVRLLDKETASVGPMALDPAIDMTYMEAVRDLPPGTVIRQHDLRPSTLVKRGQMVQILIGQGQGFQIAARVEALQDGRFGEQIKLKNLESGRILSGVVRGPGAVAGS